MKTVGRYLLRERIGEGATADVFRAYDPEIGRDLAVKILKAEYRLNPDYVQRFLREAKAAGALSHPNIVTVYDVGEADGHAYIATELLEGEPLDRLLRRGERLELEVTMLIGVQLAEALAYAHALGVVHRDIKPSNIFLSADRRTVKILDFGIARVGELDQTTFQSASPKTQVGQILGTPRYMSPEQTLGEEVDGRSDLFSVGVVLYELISGRRAFDGASAVSVALQITQSEPPSLAEIAPSAPAGLAAIIGRLLAKRADRRFADGAQLAAALKRAHQRHLAALADAAGRTRGLPLHVRMSLVTGLIVGLVLAVSIGTVLQRQYAAMKHMTLTSGVAITSFVASNVALGAAENATLPPDRRDWLPMQAFTKAAAADRNVAEIVVADAGGIIRAASDTSLIGRPYRAIGSEATIQRLEGVDVSAVVVARGHGVEGFRFVRPIIYGGRSVGAVEVTIGAGDLDATASLSRTLLAALGLVTFLTVILAALITGRALTQSLRALNKAIGEAADGDFDVRIAHRRSDELGQVFDSFNRLLSTVAARAHLAESSIDATWPADQRLDAPAAQSPRAMLSGSPFGDADDHTLPAASDLIDPDQTFVTELPVAGVQPQAEAINRLWDLLKRRRVA